MKIEVRYSLWAAAGADEPFTGGAHDLDAPSDELLGSIAAAESAGVVAVLECSDTERAKLDAAVQSQADGEAAYAAAQAEGRWQHGNLTQFVADGEARLAEALKAKPTDDAVAVVDGLERAVEEARATLAKVEEPT